MPEQKPELAREIGLRDLVLFNIAAVVGVRWLAAAAHTGPGSLTLWVLAAAFFFVPSALAVSRLGALFPEEGGLYVWTKRSFGDWHGFLCGWCYWLSNLFYFPNLLVAGLGIALYAFGPDWAALGDSPRFMLPATIAVLWAVALANIVGVRVGKWNQSLGGMATYAGGVLLVVAAAAVWATQGPQNALRVMPEWNWQRLNFWSQIAFAFGGLELGAVMGGEIRDPKRTVPRAAWLSGGFIAAFYIIGTLAILAVVPAGVVNPINGLAQAGAAAGHDLGWRWIAPALAVLITFGIAGQVGAWLSGSARVPFAIGLDRYLPPAFARLHPRWRTPHVAILAQAVACSLLLIAVQTGQSVRTAYQALVDMTVITYFIPFVYVFAAAWKHKLRITAASGLAVTIAAIGFSLVPPDNTGSVARFELTVIGASLLVIAAGRMCFRRGGRARQ